MPASALARATSPNPPPVLLDTASAIEIFRLFPYSLLVIDASGRIVAANTEASRLIHALGLDRDQLTCCAVIGCQAPNTVLAGTCVTELALSRSEGAMPEIRVDIRMPEGARSMWVAAAPLGDPPSRVVLQLRPGVANDRRRRTDPHWMRQPRLRIRCLGRTAVESAEGSIGGSWLDQRSGQLLKYLIAERHRAVHVDEIGEAIWPHGDFAVGGSVRYCIHGLRRRLEPSRPKNEPSMFVISSTGAYRLNLDNVEVDADEFEREVSSGIAAAKADPISAMEKIERGLSLYGGDFLADMPYADWAMLERGRLHDLACAGLKALTQIRLDEQMLEDAIRSLERLSTMQPYDEDVHKRLIELYIAQGRRSDAVRRYELLRERTRRTFRQLPSFTLGECEAPRWA